MSEGGVIAYPTESVWGLGCDPFNRAAVHQILKYKSRPEDKGLILISGVLEHFEPVLKNVSAQQRQLFLSEQDRPTTWLVPDPEDLIPPWVKGRFESVALRFTRNSICSALSENFGGLIVSTSANPAGRAPAVSLSDVKRYFGGRLSYCLDGPLGKVDKVSQIKDLRTGETLRV